MKKHVHLVSNAHLDPVWLWEWEEGAAEAISTFRTAADLCEEFDAYVFNHNEVVLYRWVEEYEPALFARIQRLVREGKWHIMGGWYLQPDCNMPSGESFVRQALVGRHYFWEKFGVKPTTAINFDPFGHTRGLVQILAKSGYTSYLFCRPGPQDCYLPDDAFAWVGYDGSEVLGRRATDFYNSRYGQARNKIEGLVGAQPARDPELILWGVGDHGGGPSRQDIAELDAFIAESDEITIQHSTPEAYFAELALRRDTLPRHAKDINPWGVGCYTSQVRIKQQHRRLENELYALEKMASTAALQNVTPYPKAELDAALRDLLFSEFHDMLPGSSIQPVEGTTLRLLDHGLESVSRLRARTFFAMAQGQPKATKDEIPILVYNPHPYPIETIVTCEFQLADPNWIGTFTNVTAHHDGKALPTQVEKELGNLSLDWRKRVVFRATLAPSQMTRFDCTTEVIAQKPPIGLQAKNDAPGDGGIHFQTGDLDVLVNTTTGLIDRYRVRGVDVTAPNAFQALVIRDNEDPWGMTVKSFREVIGKFTLMSPEVGTAFSGVTAGMLPSVRVIEDGPIRSVIEAVFEYEHSAICQRYLLPKQGTEIEIEVRVHWNEKDRMLKLSIPTVGRVPRYLGQVAYGVGELPANGNEAVAQKWVAVISDTDDVALTCINDSIYGSDCANGELRLSLLRSPAYSGHPIGSNPIVPQDRYTPRIDQGERLYHFWINGGPVGERLAAIDREALVKNEKPFALSFFPHGGGTRPQPGFVLSDDVVLVAAFKQAEDGVGYILRLFEPTGQAHATTVSIPSLDLTADVALGGFEIKTLYLDPQAKTLIETDLMESI
jgi:alpha-mannosidase